LRLDHRRKAIEIVEIIGLERVLVKPLVHHDTEKEISDVIPNPWNGDSFEVSKSARL
jgi:hypothetical protein